MRNKHILLFMVLLIIFPSIGLCSAPVVELPKELLFVSYSETQRGHVLVVKPRNLTCQGYAIAYYGNKGAFVPDMIWSLKGVFQEFGGEEAHFPMKFGGKKLLEKN